MSQRQLDATICIFDGFNTLLPTLAIAEVISGVAASPDQEPAFPWLIGEVNWRGLTVPMVSFEQLFIQRNPRLRGSHIAILRGQVNAENLPFYGVPVQAVPTSFTLQDSSQIEEGVEDGRLDFVAQQVRVRGVDAVIPDMPALENHMLSCLVKD